MKAKLAPYVVIGLEDRKLVHDAFWLTGEVKVNPVAEGDGVQGLVKGARCHLLDVDSRPALAGDQTELLKLVHDLLDGSAADVILLRKLNDRRELIVGSELAPADGLLYFLDDELVLWHFPRPHTYKNRAPASARRQTGLQPETGARVAFKALEYGFFGLQAIWRHAS